MERQTEKIEGERERKRKRDRGREREEDNVGYCQVSEVLAR